jgi:hypothetical protein
VTLVTINLTNLSKEQSDEAWNLVRRLLGYRQR